MAVTTAPTRVPTQWPRVPSFTSIVGYVKNFSLCLCNSNIVRVIKSRSLRWTGDVAGMEEGRSAFKILTGTPTIKENFKKA